MKKIAFIPSEGHYFDRFFDEKCPFFAPGRAKSVWYMLKQEMEHRGYQLISTQEDSVLQQDVVAVIHCSRILPNLIRYNPTKIHIFWGFEPFYCFNSRKGMKQVSEVMDYCITCFPEWNDSKQQIYSIPILYNFDVNFQPPALKQRSLLLATVSGNKQSSHSKELYSKRREVIDWFETHLPERFAFAGAGWSAPYSQYETYHGRIDCKLDFLSQSIFALCFENSRDFQGYITEKIFDAMIAGCIPVYWGASDVTSYIPEDLFLDYRKIGTPEKLAQILTQMDDATIEGYFDRIRTWLSSEQAEELSYKKWANLTQELILQGKQRTANSNACRMLKFKQDMSGRLARFSRR